MTQQAMRMERGRKTGAELVATAVVVVLLAARVAGAQTIPYESAARQSYGTGLAEEDLPKGGVFQPRLESAVQYVSNINLAPDGQDQVDTWGLELTPGFYASYSSGNFTGAMDYSLVGRMWDDSDYNDVQQSASANGQWIVVPDLFFLRGQGGISDAVINPEDGLNYGGLGLFGSQNLAQQASAGISPVLQKRFNDFQALARYSFGRVWYFDEGSNADVVGFNTLQDSKDQDFYASLGTADGSSRKLTGELFYNWQRSTYQNSLPYEYEQLGLNYGWWVAPKVSIVGDVGVESDLEKSTTEGGLDSSFWSAGVLWEPDDRTEAEFRYGSRFFGHTYYGRLSRRTRMFEFYGSYSESPQVETRTLSLGDFTPGELPPGMDPGNIYGFLTSTPFVGKDARAGIAAVGSRTKVNLDFFQTIQDYIRSTTRSNEYSGVSLSATRQFASNLSGDFSASYSSYDQTQRTTVVPASQVTTSNDYTQFLLRLNREMGGKLTTSIEAGYVTQSGQTDYDGWWTGIRAKWTP